MKAILLCAGYATRLRPLTENRPKHLLEVGGKAILSHVVERVAQLPVDSIYVVTNNKFFAQFEEWKKTRYSQAVPLQVLNDGTRSNEDRLGSIGDADLVIRGERIDEPVIMINADNLFTFDLREIHRVFLEKQNVIALYDVQTLKEARKMGAPTLDPEGRVIDFVEKPENPVATTGSIGIYLYGREAVGKIKEYVAELAAQGGCPDRTGDFVGWLAQRLPVYTHTYAGAEDRWVDIGTPEQFEKAQTLPCFKKR